jgi:hypothetical protein
MTNKIVYFPATVSARGVKRIKAYRSTSRAEVLISVWFCVWAMLTAVECVRQMSFLAI